MQAENKKNTIKTLSFGCRLNALEAEKIQNMLKPYVNAAIVVNTCAVTAEAERQSGQAVRKLVRENPNVPVWVTGCAATRNRELFHVLENTIVIHNRDKMNLSAYLDGLNNLPCSIKNPTITKFSHQEQKLSKQFVQIQNGCNHNCAYCITRQLRGPAVSFDYETILADVQVAMENGFGEIVLTGIDIASYVHKKDGKLFQLSDLCHHLLTDVPQIKRLRLSSIDPAVPDVEKIIDLIHREPRMMPHLHCSMQSGSDTILRAMGRRHSAQQVRKLVMQAAGKITFSWDIICGFPGETDKLFNETIALAQETKPIKIHAFPFSPRPGTPAADMPEQVDRSVSKKRVKIIDDLAHKNRSDFMDSQIGKTVQVLVEANNIARCPHDIGIKITGATIAPRTICDVKIIGVDGDYFIGNMI
ncbi:MAG: MiaB/RimO family radical SAM methylthiotransferase [Alphaproteobacteria bacterium]|nr:MiaB/RimO family radical SAM methylthiotransferase [Alphaproteobacteria bacterium]